MQKIEQIFTFITELDKLKEVTRQNNPVNINRRENSAEHSWQVALLAMTLQEYSPVKIEILKVIQMLLLHDIVEIDAGDTILYDETGREEKEKEELEAAKRITGLLPKEIGDEYLKIWIEFEERETDEAIYAYAMDRLMPVIQNFYNSTSTWEEHGVSLEQVLRLNRPIGNGTPEVWTLAEQKIKEVFEEIKKKATN